MPCFNALHAWQERPGEPVSFTDNPAGIFLSLPCGKCLGCRVAKAQEWAGRIMDEAQDHEHAHFVTLTYDAKHCPTDVSPTHLRLWIKRLREDARRGHPQLLGRQLRYFAAGEYGERTQRPHYHAILFGLGFKDETRYSNKLLTSRTLTESWGMGHVRYGALTHQSAAYVAGYAGGKAITNGQFIDQDRHINFDTGEIRHAPFMRCSTRPGIGARYSDRNHADLASGRVFRNGHVSHPPRYYRTRLTQSAPARGEECAHNIFIRSSEIDPRHRTAEGLTAKLVIAQQKYLARQRNVSL